MIRSKKSKIEWTGKIDGKEFQNVLFEELNVRNAELSKGVFKNVHFKNCYLGFNTEYSHCVFVDCKFYGKYSSLGSPAKYRNCQFENCQFIGTDLFTGQHFYDCEFSGVMKNPILNDKHPKIENNETVFKNCNLADLIFENVSIYGKNIFENCILPNSGIRLFDNENDKLIEKAEQVLQEIQTNDKLESEVIFRRALKGGQNPIILDNFFLNSFFKTKDSREIFERIVDGYELRKSDVNDE